MSFFMARPIAPLGFFTGGGLMIGAARCGVYGGEMLFCLLLPPEAHL